MSYINYSYKEIEKISKVEWKSKVKDLEAKFNSLLHQRLPEYILTRNKATDNFKMIYKEILFGDNSIDKARTFLFGSLYDFPSHSLVHEAYLHSLINPNRELIIFKDWKFDYLNLEVKYNNLLKVNLNDYSIIKNHVIEIYKNGLAICCQI